jgi:glycerophosphoryl diester phosphodiesterase
MTKLVAHRGYSAHYPENTMIAARAAIAAGACGIELDVQMCADGRFVVMHDDNLLRTCGSRTVLQNCRHTVRTKRRALLSAIFPRRYPRCSRC